MGSPIVSEGAGLTKCHYGRNGTWYWRWQIRCRRMTARSSPFHGGIPDGSTGEPPIPPSVAFAGTNAPVRSFPTDQPASARRILLCTPEYGHALFRGHEKPV